MSYVQGIENQISLNNAALTEIQIHHGIDFISHHVRESTITSGISENDKRIFQNNQHPSLQSLDQSWLNESDSLLEETEFSRANSVLHSENLVQQNESARTSYKFHQEVHSPYSEINYSISSTSQQSETELTSDSVLPSFHSTFKNKTNTWESIRKSKSHSSLCSGTEDFLKKSLLSENEIYNSFSPSEFECSQPSTSDKTLPIKYQELVLKAHNDGINANQLEELFQNEAHSSLHVNNSPLIKSLIKTESRASKMYLQSDKECFDQIHSPYMNNDHTEDLTCISRENISDTKEMPEVTAKFQNKKWRKYDEKQYQILEAFYDEVTFPNFEEISELAHNTKLSPIKVNQWFKYRRKNYPRKCIRAQKLEELFQRSGGDPSTKEKRKLSDEEGLDLRQINAWMRHRKSSNKQN